MFLIRQISSAIAIMFNKISNGSGEIIGKVFQWMTDWIILDEFIVNRKIYKL